MKNAWTTVGAAALMAGMFAGAQAVTAPLHYGEPAVALMGTVSVQEFFGAPGYGENPKTDRSERQFVLTLESPVDVAGNQEKPESGVTQVTLVFDPEETGVKPLVGKKVRVEGSLFHSFSGHHHTAVLLDLSSIRALKDEGALKDAPKGARKDDGDVRVDLLRARTVASRVASPDYDASAAK